MENNTPLSPINFFQIQCNLLCLPSQKKGLYALTPKNCAKYLLPNLSSLSHQEYFADVAIGWAVSGLEILVQVKQPFEKTAYPLYDRGDSFELCVDTRDVKTSGYNTRFCHHFFFLPEAVEGRYAGEDTKFRTDDAHELCLADDLQVQTSFSKSNYILQCFIPAQCLVGYDPEQFDRLGLTYRVNRYGGSSQQFSALAEEYKFQEQPSLWGSTRLIP